MARTSKGAVNARPKRDPAGAGNGLVRVVGTGRHGQLGSAARTRGAAVSPDHPAGSPVGASPLATAEEPARRSPFLHLSPLSCWRGNPRAREMPPRRPFHRPGEWHGDAKEPLTRAGCVGFASIRPEYRAGCGTRPRPMHPSFTFRRYPARVGIRAAGDSAATPFPPSARMARRSKETVDGRADGRGRRCRGAGRRTSRPVDIAAVSVVAVAPETVAGAFPVPQQRPMDRCARLASPAVRHGDGQAGRAGA